MNKLHRKIVLQHATVPTEMITYRKTATEGDPNVRTRTPCPFQDEALLPRNRGPSKKNKRNCSTMGGHRHQTAKTPSLTWWQVSRMDHLENRGVDTCWTCLCCNTMDQWGQGPRQEPWQCGDGGDETPGIFACVTSPGFAAVRSGSAARALQGRTPDTQVSEVRRELRKKMWFNYTGVAPERVGACHQRICAFDRYNALLASIKEKSVVSTYRKSDHRAQWQELMPSKLCISSHQQFLQFEHVLRLFTVTNSNTWA